MTFDRELRRFYNLTVNAMDHGVTPRGTNTTVMVEVLDENEPPRFIASYPPLTTDENIPIGTVIGRVQAYDGDQGQKGVMVEFCLGLKIIYC